MCRRVLLGLSVILALASGTALAQPVGRICDPCNPADLRSDLVVNSYWYAFGRRPSDGELKFWMAQPASDPRLASVDALVGAHLNWLRATPAEQWEVARRALREALRNVPGIERDPVVKNAVVDMIAGREGGGYRGLLVYLQKPDVRQYYVNLAQSAEAAARPAPPAPPAQPAPAKQPAPQPAQAQVQPPKTIDDVGRLSITLSPGDITKLISLTAPAPITTSNPLAGNSGGALIGNAGAGLIGNTGAALTQVTPLNSTSPLANVTPFTMPIGNNLSLPSGNAFSVQATSDPARMVTEAFRSAFGRDPSTEELKAWTEFRQKYPRSTITASATNLAETLRYLLTVPAGESQRQGMVRAAAPSVFRRAATPSELTAWSDRIRRDRLVFADLVAAMRREAPAQQPASQPTPAAPQRGRRGSSVGVGG
jgi:hypothetical protein